MTARLLVLCQWLAAQDEEESMGKGSHFIDGRYVESARGARTKLLTRPTVK